MTLTSEAKFEDRITCGLENEARNLTNFHLNTYDFDGIRLPKAENA